MIDDSKPTNGLTSENREHNKIGKKWQVENREHNKIDKKWQVISTNVI